MRSEWRELGETQENPALKAPIWHSRAVTFDSCKGCVPAAALLEWAQERRLECSKLAEVEWNPGTSVKFHYFWAVVRIRFVSFHFKRVSKFRYYFCWRSHGMRWAIATTGHQFHQFAMETAAFGVVFSLLEVKLTVASGPHGWMRNRMTASMISSSSHLPKRISYNWGHYFRTTRWVCGCYLVHARSPSSAD